MRIMRAAVVTAFVLSVAGVCAQTLHRPSERPVVRPRILGIADVSYFVSDLKAAREFWHDLLGFDAYAISKRDGSEGFTSVVLNGHQQINLFAMPSAAPPSHMQSICFAVFDIFAMKSYLHTQGIEAESFVWSPVHAGYSFKVKDPEGMTVEFVQLSGTHADARPLAAARVSTQIFHAGFTVQHLEKTMDFYQRLLGFSETWRGSSDGKTLSWINMKVPDGTDYVEFMLGANNDAKALGTKNHLSLAVPDMDKAAAVVKERAAKIGYTRGIEVRTGVNRKRQLNLYDPDGTRVELMELFTVDGKPAASSTAPPPVE